jgi:excisionase family DNA binding protein
MSREQFSTREVGQLIGRSAGSVRGMIERGELDAKRLPGVGYRIPRDAVISLAKETLLDEAGARLSDAQVARLIDQVIEHNEAVEVGAEPA